MEDHLQLAREDRRRDLDEVIRDERRAGRPRKITEEQLDELEESLQNLPTEVGFDARAWTIELLQQFIREEFEIGYTRPSC